MGSDQEGVKSFGKGMMLAAWLLLLAVLAISFNALLERQSNPNQNPQGSVDAQGIREVVLKRNRAGHYVATGRINGAAARFLLDTGATDVAIPESLAERLGLKRGAAFLSRTANGTVTAWRTRLDEVALGPVVLNNVKASILPTMQGDDVLLGMSFLKKLELVQRGSSLTLRQY